ncbi:MAG: TIGR01244 family sulfur transferase [Oceanicoccus sp.]
MDVKPINDCISIAEQIHESDLGELRDMGFTLIVCNRPDNEVAEQPSFDAIEKAAQQVGITAIHLPFSATHLTDDIVESFTALINSDQKILAYCRTGTRSCNLWAASSAKMGKAPDALIAQANQLGYDVSHSVKQYSREVVEVSGNNNNQSMAKPLYDIVVVGAGSGGIAVSASLLKRNKTLRIALIDPVENHYYQPGWTMVGAGIFTAESTKRSCKDLIPKMVSWIKKSVVSFTPEDNMLCLDDGQDIYYTHLVVCPGLTLNWAGIEGLEENLGKNGVTSNYRYDLAPYTWQLVQSLARGKAIFTQPSMPIKCAGAPQKALYLSADHWYRANTLSDIELHFYNAGGVLFGVDAYVPALQTYMEKYQANIHYNYQLFKIDGEQKKAYFKGIDEHGEEVVVVQDFDMIHVCPPQVAPDFIANSPLADTTGWLDVDKNTLRHNRFNNIWGLGDVINTANAKTLAAVRKQAPVVAQNIHDVIQGKEPCYGYDGYGSCPLTVERGKIILAEFGYGGKILPTFPLWLLQGKNPTWLAWWLKKDFLPGFYWHGMLKGHEILAAPMALSTVKESQD